VSVAYFKVLSRHCIEGSEENNENSQSETSQKRSRSATQLASVFSRLLIKHEHTSTLPNIPRNLDTFARPSVIEERKNKMQTTIIGYWCR
jgi:hypothetical protein